MSFTIAWASLILITPLLAAVTAPLPTALAPPQGKLVSETRCLQCETGALLAAGCWLLDAAGLLRVGRLPEPSPRGAHTARAPLPLCFCLLPSAVTCREEDFYDLSLEIQQNCSVTSCLRNFR